MNVPMNAVKMLQSAEADGPTQPTDELAEGERRREVAEQKVFRIGQSRLDDSAVLGK